MLCPAMFALLARGLAGLANGFWDGGPFARLAIQSRLAYGLPDLVNMA